MRLKKQAGDTLIEVLFAVTVFAMVAVGSLSIMNQGIASAERSLEITLVRQQIDAQAEAIRYIHSAYVAGFNNDGSAPAGVAAEWPKMTSKATGRGADVASDFGKLSQDGRCPTAVPGQHPFVLNARQATVWTGVPTMAAPVGGSLPPFSQVAYNGDSSVNQAYGIWVEAVPITSTNGPGFVDCHIRACWDAPGRSVPVTLGTIVRLYEPN